MKNSVKNFIHWYLGSFVLICILLLVVLYFNDLSIDEIKSVFPDALFQLIEHWFFWVILLVPYLFFLLIRFLLRNNFEWVTLVPYGGQEDYLSPLMRGVPSDSILASRIDSHWVKKISVARSFGFRVMLKPHIWISNPSFGKKQKSFLD